MHSSRQITDPVRVLNDLTAVNDFCLALLEEVLGHPIPVPPEISSPEYANDWIQHSITSVKNWLDLLGVAISPATMRSGIDKCARPENIWAVLRYFVLRESTLAADRDKTDFIVTHLFRSSLKKGASGLSGENPGLSWPYGEKHARDFQQQLEDALSGMGAGSLPDEHQQLLKQFDSINREIQNLPDFDALTSSGLIDRVRRIKQALGTSFYHPQVLTQIAIYNAALNERFHELLTEAGGAIKSFAKNIEQEFSGARAQQRTQELDQTASAQPSPEKIRAEVKTGAVSNSVIGKATEPYRQEDQDQRPFSGGMQVCSIAEMPTQLFTNAMEEARVMTTRDSIRYFVGTADPGKASIVPLPSGVVTLNKVEIEAFGADYHEENNFRGEYVSVLMYLVAVSTCLAAELSAYNSKRNTTYLWKRHADSLKYLLTAAQRAISEAAPLLDSSEERHLADKSHALRAAIDKVRAQTIEVTQALQR